MSTPDRDTDLIVRLQALADRHGLQLEDVLRAVCGSLQEVCDRLDREQGPEEARELLADAAAGRVPWEEL